MRKIGPENNNCMVAIATLLQVETIDNYNAAYTTWRHEHYYQEPGRDECRGQHDRMRGSIMTQGLAATQPMFYCLYS